MIAIQSVGADSAPYLAACAHNSPRARASGTLMFGVNRLDDTVTCYVGVRNEHPHEQHEFDYEDRGMPD